MRIRLTQIREIDAVSRNHLTQARIAELTSRLPPGADQNHQIEQVVRGLEQMAVRFELDDKSLDEFLTLIPFPSRIADDQAALGAIFSVLSQSTLPGRERVAFIKRNIFKLAHS